MNNKYYKYYDYLYINKNYEEDIKQIDHILNLKINKKLKIKRVLEVGCGTGNHTILLSKKYNYISAVDIDENMLNIARNKLSKTKNVNIFNNLKNVEGFFELSLSMFNVINYLGSIQDIDCFFNNIKKRLVSGGIYIFDMWNGVASIIDPPKNKKNIINIDSKRFIIHSLIPYTNNFNQEVIIKNEIEIYEDFCLIDKIEYSWKHILWTPKTIIDLLNKNGFYVIEILNKNNCEFQASEKDWKIMFVTMAE
jgi:SAM-dependent methyltransferase